MVHKVIVRASTRVKVVLRTLVIVKWLMENLLRCRLIHSVAWGYRGCHALWSYSGFGVVVLAENVGRTTADALARTATSGLTLICRAL